MSRPFVHAVSKRNILGETSPVDNQEKDEDAKARICYPLVTSMWSQRVSIFRSIGLVLVSINGDAYIYTGLGEQHRA